MFNFGKRKREALEKARNEIREKRKIIIFEFDKLYSDHLNKEAEKLYTKDRIECDKINSTCPICGSKHRINKFVKVKGEIESTNNNYSRSTVRGNLDTLKVNECKDCGNQWEISEPEFESLADYVDDPFSGSLSSTIGLLFRRAERICVDGEDEYPPHPYEHYEPFRTCPREVLEFKMFLWWLNNEEYYSPNQLLGTPIVDKEKSKKYNCDPLLFQFSPETWKILKKILFRND